MKEQDIIVMNFKVLCLDLWVIILTYILMIHFEVSGKNIISAVCGLAVGSIVFFAYEICCVWMHQRGEDENIFWVTTGIIIAVAAVIILTETWNLDRMKDYSGILGFMMNSFLFFMVYSNVPEE